MNLPSQITIPKSKLQISGYNKEELSSMDEYKDYTDYDVETIAGSFLYPMRYKDDKFLVRMLHEFMENLSIEGRDYCQKLWERKTEDMEELMYDPMVESFCNYVFDEINYEHNVVAGGWPFSKEVTASIVRALNQASKQILANAV